MMADTRTARPADLPAKRATGDTGLTAEILIAELGPWLEAERANRVLATASRMVADYAPQAPIELRYEAILRFSGYLAEADYGAIQSETMGPQSNTYTVNHASMFRNSGAAALLTRYRVRRAGAIG